MSYVDRTLKCIQCGNEFVFTAGEQLFFHDKQFRNDPKRCKECKSKRAAVRRGGEGRRRASTETRTNCSQCGVETTVPFRPTQGRPVLCRSCFQGATPVKETAAADGAGSIATEGTTSENADEGERDAIEGMEGAAALEEMSVAVTVPEEELLSESD